MPSTSIRVLIIDDSDLSCALLSVILRSDDYVIVGIAHDTESGLNLARLHKPNVVLLDIIMPGESGLDAIKPLKAIVPKASILMVTGVDDADIVTEAIQNGANGFIVKPFNSASVISTMRKVKEKFVVVGPVSTGQQKS